MLYTIYLFQLIKFAFLHRFSFETTTLVGLSRNEDVYTRLDQPSLNHSHPFNTSEENDTIFISNNDGYDDHSLVFLQRCVLKKSGEWSQEYDTENTLKIVDCIKQLYLYKEILDDLENPNTPIPKKNRLIDLYFKKSTVFSQNIRNGGLTDDFDNSQENK